MRLSPIAVALLLVVAPPAFARDIRIGVLAYQGSERAIEEFAPTRDQIERSLPDARVQLLTFDLEGVSRAVAEKAIDFVITNPGQYIDLESRFGATRLATLETSIAGSMSGAIASTVIAPAGAAAPRSLRDLAGKRVAVVSDQAFGGYQTVWREMDDQGLSPARFQTIVQTGFPMERVIEAVRAGKADAGVLRACVLESLVAAGRVRPDEFAIVDEQPASELPCKSSTRLYPDWPFAKTRDTPSDLAKAVAASLLAMPAVDGRAWTAPQDYTSVHDLFRQLKIGPYAYLAQPSLTGLVRDYWHWLALALLAVGWWIVHVARVETLVRRRTAELEREIHERERAEQEARSHREQRDQFSRLGIMGEMASNIAHELNQPLAAISNFAEGMTRMIDGGRLDPAMLREGARGVAGQAERAGAIIQRIRSFVRRREAKRELVDPNDVVKETVALFEGLAARRGLNLYVHLGQDTPHVLADRIEIEQVLLNLLQNAVDSMSDAAPENRLEGVTVRTSRSDGDARIAVRDAGCGLAPNVEARLFETFFTTKPQGLGLGLSICRTIVESHGGRMWATPNNGAGLTMRFTLPAAGDIHA
jgi:two-component system, LuxR family, sensor histidine kinase TtrS